MRGPTEENEDRERAQEDEAAHAPDNGLNVGAQLQAGAMRGTEEVDRCPAWSTIPGIRRPGKSLPMHP